MDSRAKMLQFIASAAISEPYTAPGRPKPRRNDPHGRKENRAKNKQARKSRVKNRRRK